eukprot:5299414-Prorocentrum_lima.AAC.1
MVVCDADQAEIIYAYIAERLQAVGIELNLGKTEIWKADPHSALAASLCGCVVDSLKVVGSQ